MIGKLTWVVVEITGESQSEVAGDAEAEDEDDSITVTQVRRNML